MRMLLDEFGVLSFVYVIILLQILQRYSEMNRVTTEDVDRMKREYILYRNEKSVFVDIQYIFVPPR